MTTAVPSSGDSTSGAQWKGEGVVSGDERLTDVVAASGREVLHEPRAIVHAVSDQAAAAPETLSRSLPPPGLARVSVRSTAGVRRDAWGSTGTARIDASRRASQRYQRPTVRRESPGAPWVG